MSGVTVFSVTDEQVLDLANRRYAEKLATGGGTVGDLCIVALSTSHYETRHRARERVAAMINAEQVSL